MAKTTHLQIRVSPAEKRRIREQARRTGMRVSTYVLSRLQPSGDARVPELVRALGRTPDRFGFASLNDALAGLTPAGFAAAVHTVEVDGLSDLAQNYVAAMVEETARRLGVAPPGWTKEAAPLEHPYFAVPFMRLRPHPLRTAPVAYKRRNLFVDATVGDRV